jgi:putative DNA primase/helicase
MIELEIYRRLNLPLIYWKRVGDDPSEWKGPHERDWNDPAKRYDFDRYDPAVHNLGVPTGREISPGRFLADIDLDKLIPRYVTAFFPRTSFALTRRGKEVSHLFHTTSAPLTGKRQYTSPCDGKPYAELRGTRHQTMLAPSLHTPPDIRIELLACEEIAHIENVDTLIDAHLDYCFASLVTEMFPGGVHHDVRLPIAGYLLKRQFEPDRVRKLLQTICQHQVHCRVPEMGQYDIDDVETIIKSSVDRLARGQEISGTRELRTLSADFVERLRTFFPRTGDGQHPLTEAGDAECLADLYGEECRHDHRRGRWLVSDETSGIWIPDPVECLTQMTVDMMRTRQRQALAITDLAKREMAMKWAIRGESRNRITNTLAIARSVPPLADTGEHWDEDPFLLGVQNGVVDLRTGTFRKATPDDRVTMRVRAAYDRDATCPLWLKTLADIFPAASEMIAFVQRALGYSITGDCREECCFFAWGDGCNGKGTIMNTLGWLLGDYTDDLPYSTLERSDRGSGIPNDIAKLAGKRFITCAEVNEFNLNEARLKALTGRDPMTARFLHREFFTFIPVCKIWIATNNKPRIIGQDDGVWRRIHLIPFTQSFEGRENKQLKDELRKELPGILNWIIAGTALWLRDGLNPPNTVKAATEAYRRESDPLTPFIEVCCIEGTDDVGQPFRMQASAAFNAYERFVSGPERLSHRAFYKAMEQRFEKRNAKRQQFYIGVGLRAPVNEVPEPKHDEPVQGPSD